MSEIETLTEEERGIVQRLAAGENDNVLMSVAQAVEKLLLAHDAQAHRILELEASMQDLFREAGRAAFILRMPLAPLPTCRICGETRFSAGTCEECGADEPKELER
jgi:hypothetical protein